MDGARVEVQLKSMDVPPPDARAAAAVSPGDVFARWCEAEKVLLQAADLKLRAAFCQVFHPLRSLSPRTARKVSERLPAFVLNGTVIWSADPGRPFACPGCEEGKKRERELREGGLLSSRGIRDAIDPTEWPAFQRAVAEWRAAAEEALKGIAAAMESYLQQTEAVREQAAKELTWLRIASGVLDEEEGAGSARRA